MAILPFFENGWTQEAMRYEDLIYDVGMHKGEDTDFYLKKGFRVVAFEANPDLVKECRNRFIDEIENGKLIVVHGAITKLPPERPDSRTVKFYKNNNNSVWGTVSGDWARRNEILGTTSEVIDVPVVDFVECLSEYGIPHYLKIDIEGMDHVCLESLRGFKERPKYVSIESEKVSFPNLLSELDLLVELGYSKFKAVQQRGISRQYEPVDSKEGSYVGYRFKNESSGLFGSDLPGRWEGHAEVARRYKRIFTEYRLFGDYGKFKQFVLGRILRRVLIVILRRPVPGWYDTHARHHTARP